MTPCDCVIIPCFELNSYNNYIDYKNIIAPPNLYELIEIIIGKDMEMANRAAWVIPSIADKNIDKLIQPYLKTVILLCC